MKKRLEQTALSVCAYLKNDFWYELFACALYAIGVSMFLAPNCVISGGVTGVATIVNQLFDIPVGVTSFALNIPLIVIGFFGLGHRFLFRTLRVVIICSAMTDVAAMVLPAYRSETVLIAVFGGALMGAGLGFIFRLGSSTGGSDIIIQLLRKRHPNWSFGSIMVATDFLVIGGAAFLFRDLDLLILGTLQMVVAGFVTDRVILGSDERKMVLMVTQQPDLLVREICDRLSRGVTVFHTVGGYLGEPNCVLMCVIESRQLTDLKRLVNEIDPATFLIVTQASEIIGNGFKPMGEI
jgi:uncharacterized membrane-anchored protein YitT (DUF2179 family)